MNEEDSLTLYTIGHSTHALERFVGLLKQHEIRAIADVRSAPFSRFTPQFNREPLDRSLRDIGIRYVFLGDELGARRSESECYIGNKVSYALVARLPVFRKGIERLKEGAKKMRVAIMCAEKDPITCHRAILVAREARPAFHKILHVLNDGSLETHEQVEERLLAAFHAEEADLFLPREKRLEDAYRLRSEEIAYEENLQTVQAHT
jgi:uncharacterized protein (DUF488 family)